MQSPSPHLAPFPTYKGQPFKPARQPLPTEEALF